uniref:CCHC-type domain-containing protein n=1 Tax=Magallana gigas TaxID=29159 RepID=A0A8W8NTZ3_MAGGI
MSVVRSELPIPLPTNVKGNLKKNRKFFKSQWMNYEIATGLDKKQNAIRIATLLTVIDKDGYHIYENLTLTEEERQDQRHIIKRQNVKRSRLNTGQSYNNVFDKRKNFNTAAEVTTRHQSYCEFRSECVSSKGDKAYKPRGKHPFKGQGKKQQETVQPKNSAIVIKRKYCGGKHPRDRDKCPAFGHTCWKCKKKNHLPKVCKQTTVNSIQDEDTSDSASDSLYAVNSSSGKQGFVKTHMSASGNSSNVTCPLDSVSTCNIINFWQYVQIMHQATPTETYREDTKALRREIETHSSWHCNLEMPVHKLTTTSSQFKPMSKEQILDEFKGVFEGLGEFEGEYHIELDPTVKPVQRQPRRVPQALKGELKEKI